MLAGHVVRGGEHVPERRPAEHERGSVGAGDPEREVAASASDQVVGERPGCAVDVPRQPFPDPLFVDSPHGG